jgi:GNAT superfamily N-acetyltransferase
MARFFIRLIALIGSLSILAIGMAVLINLTPNNVGGVAVWIGLFALLLLVSYASYRGMVSGFVDRKFRGTGVGAGLVMGAAVEEARSRDGEGDEGLF